MKDIPTIKAKKPLQGEVTIPGDKSISHRSIILSAISSRKVEIDYLLEGEDVMATIAAFQDMGVKIKKTNSKLVLEGEKVWSVQGIDKRSLKKPSKALNMGNSGTTTRLMMGILAAQDFECVIDGDESLRKRPMKRVTEPLSQMGAKFEFLEKDGYLPIKIIGNPNLKPLKNYEMPVASAQIKSAILLAGLYAKGATSIIERNPTRDHTERMMREFGVGIEKIDDTTIEMQPGFIYPEFFVDIFRIPADPSSAAFFITAALLVEKSKIHFYRLSKNNTRTGFLDVITEILKCNIEMDIYYENEGEPCALSSTIFYTKIENKEYVIPAEYAPRMIDEYPILAVLAAGSEATIRMEGISELRVKESDRIAVMQKGLEACGVKVESGEDWMTVYGTGKVKGGARIETHLDHRIAMSFIILGLIAEEPITIDDISPIQTSFPNFLNELESLLGVDYGI